MHIVTAGQNVVRTEGLYSQRNRFSIEHDYYGTEGRLLKRETLAMKAWILYVYYF